MKNSSVQSRKGYYSGVIIALFVVAAVAVVTLSSRKRAREEEAAIPSKIRALVGMDRAKSPSVDPWWLKGEPSPTIDLLNLIEAKKERLRNLLLENADLTEETKLIAARFSQMKAGILVSGGYTYLEVGGVSGAPQGKEIGVCFVPYIPGRPIGPYMLQWQTGGRNQNRISIPAVELPQKLLLGAIFHELGHGLRHNTIDGIDKSDAKPESREGKLEEVRMHEFAGDIMSKLTDGKYRRLIDETARRHKGEKRFDRLVASLSADEKSEVQSLFECEGKELARAMLMSQFVFLLGFRLAELEGKGDDGKIMIYEWYIKGYPSWTLWERI